MINLKNWGNLKKPQNGYFAGVEIDGSSPVNVFFWHGSSTNNIFSSNKIPQPKPQPMGVDL